MIRLRKSINRIKMLNNNQGSTMVETLVAFVVLMIILAIMYGVIAFCSELRMRAEDTSRAVVKFRTEMYNSKNAPEGTDFGVHKKDYQDRNITVNNYVTGKKEVEKEDGLVETIPVPLLYFQFDTEETNVKNLQPGVSGATVPDEMKEKFSLYNIEAVTYTYHPTDGEEDEKIIIPKAITFIHKRDR